MREIEIDDDERAALIKYHEDRIKALTISNAIPRPDIDERMGEYYTWLREQEQAGQGTNAQ